MTETTDSVRAEPVDFLIIGAMKSGTSTLHAWLDLDPAVAMCSWKEPSFFSVEEHWDRGFGWYEGLFPGDAGTRRRGEASTSYTDPRHSETAASRIAESAPGARLVYLLRHPIERARSHYRHQVQRGREKRPLIAALSDPDALYLPQSHYWSCLAPYVERFDEEQILVVTLEALTGADGSAWKSVQEHIGLESKPRPNVIRNVTDDKQQFTPVMRWLWERDLLPSRAWVPPPLRALGRRILLRQDDAYEKLIAGSRDPIPADLQASVWQDIEQLEAWLGYERPIWERS